MPGGVYMQPGTVWGSWGYRHMEDTVPQPPGASGPRQGAHWRPSAIRAVGAAREESKGATQTQKVGI